MVHHRRMVIIQIHLWVISCIGLLGIWINWDGKVYWVLLPLYLDCIGLFHLDADHILEILKIISIEI